MQRIDWMRVNPLVCVETDNVVSSEEWVSIIIFGRYEELADTPEFTGARAWAHHLLQQKATWWEPGCVKTIVQGAERPLVPVYFRIHIKQITGHQGTPDSVGETDAKTKQSTNS